MRIKSRGGPGGARGWTKSVRRATGCRQAVLRSSCKIGGRELVDGAHGYWVDVLCGVLGVPRQRGGHSIKGGTLALEGMRRASRASVGALGGWNMGNLTFVCGAW